MPSARRCRRSRAPHARRDRARLVLPRCTQLCHLEHLLHEHGIPVHAHAGALVETGRSSGARRVDAEGGASVATAPKVGEGVQEQRLAESLARPRPAYAERRHVAGGRVGESSRHSEKPASSSPATASNHSAGRRPPSRSSSTPTRRTSRPSSPRNRARPPSPRRRPSAARPRAWCARDAVGPHGLSHLLAELDLHPVRVACGREAEPSQPSRPRASPADVQTLIVPCAPGAPPRDSARVIAPYRLRRDLEVAPPERRSSRLGSTSA